MKLKQHHILNMYKFYLLQLDDGYQSRNEVMQFFFTYCLLIYTCSFFSFGKTLPVIKSI